MKDLHLGHLICLDSDYSYEAGTAFKNWLTGKCLFAGVFVCLFVCMGFFLTERLCIKFI